MKLLFWAVVLLYSLFPFSSNTMADGGDYSQSSKTQIAPLGELEAKAYQAALGTFDSLGHDIFWTIISVVFGGFAGLALVIATDTLKTPILSVKKGNEALSGPNHPTGNFKIIHIKVRNKNKKYRFLPIGINTAFSTQGKITLKGKQGQVSFVGKWTLTPQPILNGQVQPDMAMIPPRIDIYPSNLKDDEFQEIAIGIKHSGEDEFYGFSNESYVYDPQHLKHPGLKFGIGKYDGLLRLATLGVKFEFKFKLNNKSSNLQDFYLEIVD